MPTPPWQEIAAQIGAAHAPFSVAQAAPVGGGCINSAYRIEGDGRCYFVKANCAARAPMFEAEAAGLAEIAASASVRAPRVVCCGSNERFSWLVLEYVEMGGGNASGLRRLGEKLARMHRTTAPRFGWKRDNTIGATPQINTPGDDWTAFWRERRLGFQLKLAAQNGCGGGLQRKGERLMEALPEFFRDCPPRPSLLHGDLWGGNYGIAQNGEPVIFDPAVYYGDRECDLAMTELFGGFGADFYAAYREAFPLDPGYRVRKHLYNLYHILNHANLFGGGYARQAEGMMDKLLAEV